MYKIAYSNDVLKDLRKILISDAKRIREKIAQYAVEPASLALHVKKLKGRKGYRLRIGKWRVIFDVEGNVLAVLMVAARGSIYGS